MSNNDFAKMSMYDLVKLFLLKNKDRFIGYDRLVSEITTFMGYLLLLAPIVATQSEPTTGVTANKTTSFSALGMLLVKIGRKALVFANDNNDQVLANVFKITNSGYKSLPQAKKLIQAQGFLDVLVANADALVRYKITSDDIKMLTDLINNCAAQSTAPGTMNSRKKAATTAFKTTSKLTDGSLAIIDSLINSDFADSDADFVNEYFNSRRLAGKGVRHTGITATFTDAATGKAIEGAAITIEKLSKTAVSNISGVAEIPTMRGGTYHISFTANGYAPQMQDINVPKGKTVELAVALVVA